MQENGDDAMTRTYAKVPSGHTWDGAWRAGTIKVGGIIATVYESVCDDCCDDPIVAVRYYEWACECCGGVPEWSVCDYIQNTDERFVQSKVL